MPARPLIGITLSSGARVGTDTYFDSAADGSRPFSDFEWYAVDSGGQVAFLTSAGFGPIPLLVFRDKAAYFAAAQYFESLPVRCGHALHARRPHEWSSWTEAANRGLFAYDWTATAGQYVPGHPYELMARPDRPLLLAELPEAVQNWLAPIRFGGEFGSDLSPERDFPEVNLRAPSPRPHGRCITRHCDGPARRNGPRDSQA